MSEMNKTGTVDRFEGEFAIVEFSDKTMIDVEKINLSPGIKEGDKIYLGKEGKWIKDEQTTDEARKRIRKLMDDLFE
jgi:hypothetical protein